MPAPLYAMILAAGRGTRMRPLTDHTPKPLLRVGGKSLIEWHIERLAAAGITHIVINHAWLGQKIEDQLGDGSRYGVSIQYSAEEQALETAAGIKKALPLLTDGLTTKAPFLVISADIWSEWNPALAFYMLERIRSEQALAHLLLVPNPTHNPKGDFAFDLSKGLVLAKSDTNNHNHININTYTYSGMGVFSPDFFNEVSATTPTPLRQPLADAMAKKKALGTLYNGVWADIGTPERLQQIEQSLAQ